MPAGVVLDQVAAPLPVLEVACKCHRSKRDGASAPRFSSTSHGSAGMGKITSARITAGPKRRPYAVPCGRRQAIKASRSASGRVSAPNPGIC